MNTDPVVEKTKHTNADALARVQRMELLETQGMEAAKKEHATLRQIIDQKILYISKNMSWIKLEKESANHEYLIRTDRVSLNFYLDRTSPVTESRIVIQEFDGRVVLRKDREPRALLFGEEPRQVSKKGFHFDYVESSGWCWKERRRRDNCLTTPGLAEHIIGLILDLHQRFQGRDRVFSRESGCVGR